MYTCFVFLQEDLHLSQRELYELWYVSTILVISLIINFKVSGTKDRATDDIVQF